MGCVSALTLQREATYMRISTKGRYALMVLIDLAEQGQDKPVSLRDPWQSDKAFLKNT